MTALIVSVTGLLLTLLTGRVARIGLLAIQYAAVAWLTGLALPLQVAAVKLVAGMIACGILAVSESKMEHPPLQLAGREFGTTFRLFAAGLGLVTAFGLSQRNWFEVPDIGDEAILGSTVMLTMGLLQLGLSGSAFRVCLGLMTLLSGFEVVYSLIEPSLAVLALIASIHIGLALVSSYLGLVSATPEDPQGVR
ncbi:MAG: hypothetical protein ACRDHG_04420 [Anaerolineales bacterium]